MDRHDLIDNYPAWLRETDVALTSSSHIVLSGNTLDTHLIPRRATNSSVVKHLAITTVEAVRDVLERAGFRTIIRFDPVNGATSLVDLDGQVPQLLSRLASNLRVDGTQQDSPAAPPAHPEPPLGDSSIGTGQLIGLLRNLPETRAETALIIEGASRLARGGDQQDPDFHRLMVVAEQAARASRAQSFPGSHTAPLHRTVVWILDRPNEFPTWFVAGPKVRAISVPAATRANRRTYAETLARALPQRPETAAAVQRVADAFADSTAGFPLSAMLEITRLAGDQRIGADQIEDAVRMYRVGIPANPWNSESLRERIRQAPEQLTKAVYGQERAIRKSVDILIRSASGLKGAQTRSVGSRPQGVLFFAGPTGVGKTELAKELAALVFGNRDAMHRFDMSEFSQEQSEARLIGSPPGFRDHDAGGQLTNAVRQDPFSLLLFDEIDKAHPRILDKFLQILEDGRLTDGSGSTVHFSETLIIFTSNLGIYEVTQLGDSAFREQVVSSGAPYSEVEAKVNASIKDHFTYTLGRPEILNRLGDNVVVFDFVHPDVGAQIALNNLHNLARTLRETQDVELSWTKEVEHRIRDRACENLEFGGRGVGSVVESMVVNPLARAMFALDSAPRTIIIRGIDEDETGWSVQIEAEG